MQSRSHRRGPFARLRSRPLAAAVRTAAARWATEALEPRALLAGDGPIILSEVMYHAASQNPADEWVELYNRGTSPVNLGGWSFDKGLAYTFGNATLNPGQYLVLARDLARFQSQHPGISNVVGGWTTGQLGNNGDDLRLLDSAGAVDDELSYATQGDWALRRRGPTDLGHQGWIWTTTADGGGSSIELVNPALGNDSGQNWKTSTPAGGTPGAANSVASTNVAPLILDLQQFPLVPKSTDTVTITARLSDEQTTGLTAALKWRVDGAASFTSAAMLDDGAHGDGAPGDGVYGAILPAQPNNTVVEYYLSATDSTAHTRTWPAPTDTSGTQGANALYQVDDSPTYSGGQNFFKIIMTEAERAELATIGDGAAAPSNAEMNATLIASDGAGTEARYTIGVRNRGGGSRTAEPNNYRVNLNNDHTWRGVRALSFNGQYSMEEVAASAVLRAAGVPAQEAIAVQVRVNNANLATVSLYDMFGSYSMVEVENSDMAERQFPTDPQGNYYRAVDGAHNADLSYLGTDPTLYYTKYPKQTNSELNDYSDLIDLTRTFDATQTPAAQFLSKITQKLNLTEWLRYFAANALLGNQETTLATGEGDDYSLYHGVNDPKWQVVAHDLDTVLGRGDTAGVVNESVFIATGVPAVSRLLKDPAIAPLYYAQLKDLATTIFAANTINPLLDHAVGAYAPAGAVDTMKQFAAARSAAVLAQVPAGVTATTSLTVQNGYPRTTAGGTSAGALTGTADAVNTRSVLVNGAPATWTAWSATWSSPTVTLRPGINRIVVQALDGTGKEIARTSIDVWRDTGATTNISGTLGAGTTTWSAASGPYRVTAGLTVPAGATLVIQPGTTVFFDAGVGMTVNGQITAVGTDTQRIVLARTPTAASAWDRVLVNNTQTDSKIAYAIFENAGSGSENIQITSARLDMDHLEWVGTTAHLVDVVSSSFRLTNSVTPNTVDVEPIHYRGTFPANGYALIQGNTFGRTTGHNDIIDFTGGNRPGPIVQFLDNLFLGAGDDDLLDLDSTDAHIEGNVFMNVPHTTTADTSSAISGGTEPGLTDTSEIVSVRNFFFNVDHGFLMKENNSVRSINDTFVNVYTAIFNFSEPGFAPDPGVGGFADGDIFFNVPVVSGVAQIVQNPPTGSFVVNRSIAGAGAITVPGVGNLTGDPHLANTTNVTDPRVDFRLTGGPAIGTGPNGRDMGAAVPAGATISGEPIGTTYKTAATLTIGGPDIYAYKYRVNGGAWSAEIPVSNPGQSNVSIPPIQLTALTNGTYTVQVVKKNSAGFWQADAEATNSKTWTVSVTASRVVINEVMALRSGNQPDLIELFNDGASARDISGMSITDDPTKPAKFVFPAGTTIPAGGYLILTAGDADGSAGIHTGFALDKDGEGVYLYNTTASGGAQVDAITFGAQLADYSIGRLPDGAGWTLNIPTFGAANVAQPLGDPNRLKINEWLTNGFPPYTDDFIELYNPDPLPVNMAGLYLTDEPTGWPNQSQVPALSFAPGGGFAVFLADGNGPSATHVNFSLAQEQGTIGLFNASLHQIDAVVYGAQQAGVSEGRVPDGGSTFGFFAQPNPGVSNPAPTSVVTVTNFNLLALNSTWRYNQTQNLDGTGWTTTGYNDSVSPWASGGGLLYVEGSALPGPKTTALAIGSPERSTYYFRTHFTLNADPSTLTALDLQTVLDDGAVIHINGHEVYRIGMSATGTPAYATFASRNIDNATLEGPFSLLAAARQWLVHGDNLIAVEVHQINATSSDIVWGGALTATATIVTNPSPPPAIRVTELNFNPGGSSGTGFTKDDYEFIEIKNTGNTAVDLAGMKFTAGVDATLPTFSLAPGAVGVLVKNPTAFANRYGSGIPVIGTFTGDLDDNGEELRLLTAQGQVIQDFSFSDAWFKPADGGGYTLRSFDPSADPTTWSLASAWRQGRFLFGSPGIDEPTAVAQNTVVINELLTHSHGAGGDWIELRNTTASPINIGGWYLSDSASNLLKYRIPTNTIVPANGFLVLDESTSFGSAFQFSEDGDEAYLTASASAGVESGYRVGESYGATTSDVPLGRFTNSVGKTDFIPMSAATKGAANAAPAVGPVVINELMYNPLAGTGKSEFIELRNLTSSAVPLYDPARPSDTWHLTGGVDFALPAGASIPANGYALIVPVDPAIFRAQYNIAANIPVFGPYTTDALDNNGERIALARPDGLEADGAGPGVRYVEVDAIEFSDAAPWPTSPDGAGPSLARINSAAFGDDPANWAAEVINGSPRPPQLRHRRANDPRHGLRLDALSQPHHRHFQQARDRRHQRQSERRPQPGRRP
jgi:hypothetical protein